MPHEMLRPLNFGEILDGTFSLYRRHFATLLLTALIPVLPMALALAGFFAAGAPGTPEAKGVTVFLLSIPVVLVGGIGMPLGWAALTRQFSQAVTGGTVSLSDGYAHGKRTFLPLMGMWLLAYSMVVLVGIAFAILLPLSARFGMGARILVTIGGVGGFCGALVALIGPVFVGPAAVIIEERGAREALKRSWELIRGGRLRAVALGFVAGIIGALPVIGLGMVLGVVVALAAPGAFEGEAFWFIAMQQVVSVLANSLTLPFTAGAMTLFYFDRVSRLAESSREVLDEALAPIA
jgi:hypothetical protein